MVLGITMTAGGGSISMIAVSSVSLVAAFENHSRQMIVTLFLSFYIFIMMFLFVFLLMLNLSTSFLSNSYHQSMGFTEKY